MHLDFKAKLHQQGSFVAPRLAFLGCFLYLSAYFSSNLVAKLRLRKQQLAQGQALSRSVFDAIGHGIIVLDPQNNILCFNQFMHETYGWTDNNLAQNIFELCPDLVEAGLCEQLQSIVEQGQTAECRKLRRVTQQGHEVYQNVWGYPLYQDGEIAGTVVVIEDITRQAQTEEALRQQAEETRRRNEELAARNTIARAVSRSLDIDDILKQLYQEVNQLLEPDTFFVALYDAAEELFDVALVIERGQELPCFSAKLDATGGLTAWVIRECQPLLIRDLPAEVDNLPADPKHLTEPARSWLSVPLVARGQVTGVLSVQSFEPDAFDEADQRFLSAVADHIAMAIDNAQLYAATRHMAVTDGLTGLYNSRYFYQTLEQELSRSERYRHPLALIMLDLDDFKKYNDLYGHLAGDDLLKELAGLIVGVTRATDVAARYGGEEFAIILPETTAEDAAKLAERLRKRVEQHEFEVENGEAVGRITISAGVAACSGDVGDAKELVHRADMALLDAKITKNTVNVFSPSQ